jgi:hypothetical protein
MQRLATEPTDLGEEMVDDVIMCDIMQEKSALPAKERPVNGCSSPSLERPGRHTVVRNASVLKRRRTKRCGWLAQIGKRTKNAQYDANT